MKRSMRMVAAMVLLISPLALADQQKDKSSKAMKSEKRSEKMGAAVDKKDRQQIEQVVKEVDRAWNKGDAKTMAKGFTADATLMNPFGEKAKGLEEVERLFESDFEGKLKGSRTEAKLLTLTEIAPGLVLADGERTVIGVEGAPGPMTVSFTALFEKRADGYKVAHVRGYQLIDPPQTGVGGAGAEGQGMDQEMMCPCPMMKKDQPAPPREEPR